MKYLKAFLFVVLQSITVASLAMPLVCADVFSDEWGASTASPQAVAVLKVLNQPELLQAYIDPKIAKISWKSFQVFEALKPVVAEYIALLNSMNPEQKVEERRQVLRLLNQTPQVNAFFDFIAQSPKQDYLPTEYDLKRKMFSQMSALIKTLPAEFRPRVGKIAFDQRAKVLNKDAIEFVAEHERRFDKLFEANESMTYAEFDKLLRSSEDPIIKKAIELIEKDKMEIVMRRPESGRFWIPKTGFQNQYVSGTSNGYQGKSGRYNAEATMTSRTKNEYWPLDDEMKPKYGTLRLSNESGIKNNLSSSTQYGDDIFVFKKPSITSRLTFTPGDSLSNLHRQYPQWETLIQTPESWGKMFIPWSRRLLMIPFMVESLKKNSFGVPSSPTHQFKGWNGSMFRYWESQIFGRVDLDMVETFMFERSPPAGEFLHELKKRNIKIMDARTEEVKEWTEGSK